MPLYMMVTIADRARFPGIIALYQQRNVLSSFIALGHGTATGELLNYFGLDSSEKAVCFSVVTGELWLRVKKDLEQKIHIDVPGVGVAFTVPMSSIGGKRELAFLTEHQHFQKGDESVMQGTTRELLVVISNQGFNELVMDAAREAGAYGGTVIHARGTGMERAERFLGISLASEKDITFIVTKTSQKNAIMEAVMRKAGMDSRAKSIVFSLPVSSTAGLRLLDETDEPDEKDKSSEKGKLSEKDESGEKDGETGGTSETSAPSGDNVQTPEPVQ